MTAAACDAAARVVLVVDDDDDIREALRLVLETEGVGVAEAADGAAALAWLATHPPPRLILLDLMMPVLDGAAVVARLRAAPAWAALPVVMLTAAPRAARTGLPRDVPVLAKPLDLGTLLAVVAAHCGAPGGA